MDGMCDDLFGISSFRDGTSWLAAYDSFYR
jgi:hypothetical protein